MVSHPVIACIPIRAFMKQGLSMPGSNCLLFWSSCLHVALSKALVMSKQWDKDINIIRVEDASAFCVMSMENHTCISIFVITL